MRAQGRPHAASGCLQGSPYGTRIHMAAPSPYLPLKSTTPLAARPPTRFGRLQAIPKCKPDAA